MPIRVSKLTGPASTTHFWPSLAATAQLITAELALRSLHADRAREALDRARAAAELAGVPALKAEVVGAETALVRPAARRIFPGGEATLRLDEVASLMASGALVVDACRRGLRAGDAWRPLARRPVLFALLRALAEQPEQHGRLPFQRLRGGVIAVLLQCGLDAFAGFAGRAAIVGLL